MVETAATQVHAIPLMRTEEVTAVVMPATVALATAEVVVEMVAGAVMVEAAEAEVVAVAAGVAEAKTGLHARRGVHCSRLSPNFLARLKSFAGGPGEV